MRQFCITFILILFSTAVFSQKALNIYDISQQQLHLMQQYQNADSLTRSKVFIKSLYNPYQQFWNGYLGKADDVANWLNAAMPKLPEWIDKNIKIDGKKLQAQLRHTAKEMTKLTGYAPQGNWYIVYGPAWTDLGGLGDFAMLIDLAHASNSSNEKIAQMFPHELTHQILANVNKHKDTTALSSIIGEGFAVWMNQKYWKQKFTLAQHLGYSEEELKNCESYLEKLKGFVEKNKYSTNKDMIEVFRSRSAKLNEKLPGAIGYYLGYKIVESYVQKNGTNSWKDVFNQSPKAIYERSGFTTPM